MNAPRAGRWCLVAPLAAALIYARTLGGGFLSDDFLLNYLLRDGEAVRVAWGEVLADFARPWLGLEGGVLYRPVLSLSYAFDLAAGGGSPLPFHVTNVAALAVSAYCCSSLCAFLAPTRARPAAVLGGLLYVLHPSVAEATAWVSGRVSGLETAWSALTMLAFARHLRSGGRSALGLTTLFAALALGTKESAIVLPVSLLALDVLGTADPWRARARRHLALAPLWVVYLGARWLALGRLVGTTMQEVAGSPLARFADTLPGKLQAILAPTMPGALWTVLGIATLWVLAVQPRTRHAQLAVGVTLGWALAHLVPGYQIEVGEYLGGSRVVSGLALCLPLGFVAAARAARLAALPWTLAGALAAAGGAVTWTRLDAFADGWARVDAVRAELEALGAGATPARPVAVLAVPSERRGVPLLNPNAVFPLLERPFARDDRPVVGLGFTLVHIPDMAGLHGDASPLRALSRAGATLVTIDGTATRMGSETARPPALRPSADQSDVFRFERPVSPYRVEGLVIEVGGAIPGGRVTWLPEPASADDAWYVHDFGPGEVAGDRTRFVVDLTHEVALLAQPAITGFRVELDGAEEEVTVQVLHRLPILALASRLDGAEWVLGDAARAPRAPDQPRPEMRLRLVLLGPHGGHAFDIEPGVPVRMPADVARNLRRLDRAYRQNRFWYYFEAESPDGRSLGGARSELDWFRLRVAR